MYSKQFKKDLQRLKGRTLDKDTINIIVGMFQDNIFNALYEGWEIWDASCQYRIMAGRDEKDFGVCEYYNPLHAIKEFDTLDQALKFVEKKTNN